MGNNEKQREELPTFSKWPRRPRHRRTSKMEELPTFAKWLSSLHTDRRDDTISKSKLGNGYRSSLRPPVVVVDSPAEGGAVPNLSSEEVVVAVGDTISAQGGFCCWQNSESTQRGISLKFHISLRRRRVIAKVPKEAVAAGVGVSKLQEEEKEVAAGGGCWCCRNPNSCEEGSGHGHGHRRSCLPRFHICGRGKNKVAAGVSDLDKPEEVATVVPDLQKEGNGCCCARWNCLPAFQNCRRRKMAAGEEGVAGDVPAEEKLLATGFSNGEERVDDGGVNMEEGDFRSAQRVGWFHICAGRKKKVASTNVPNSGREEKLVTGVADLQEKEVAAAGALEEEEKETAGVRRKDEVIVAVMNKEKGVDAGDTPDLHEEEIVATGIVSDMPEEEEEGCCRCFKPAGKGNGRRRRRRSSRYREGCWPFHICRGEKKVRVSIPNLDETEGLVMNEVSDVHNEEVDVVGATTAVAAADHFESTQGCGCWQSKPGRRRWLPMFQIFSRKRKTVATEEAEEDGGDGGRCSKAKRRRGCLRRRGRRQREKKR